MTVGLAWVVSFSFFQTKLTWFGFGLGLGSGQLPLTLPPALTLPDEPLALPDPNPYRAKLERLRLGPKFGDQLGVAGDADVRPHVF